MTIAINDRPIYAPITEELQAEVIDKMSHAIVDTVRDVLTILIQSNELRPMEFVAQHVAPHQQALKDVDKRTHRFLLSLSMGVNEEIDKLETMKEVFNWLANETHDRKVRDKFIQGVALQRVKMLVESFDQINPEIIDRMNRPFSLRFRVSQFFKQIASFFSCC